MLQYVICIMHTCKYNYVLILELHEVSWEAIAVSNIVLAC